MKPWMRGLLVIAGMALLFVTVSSIAQAVEQRSWGPIAEGLWIPAVVLAASWPAARGRCLPRRHAVPGNPTSRRR